MSAAPPPPLDTFTMRALSERRSSGRHACVVRQAPSTFVSNASLTTSRSAPTLGLPGVVEAGGVVDQNVEGLVVALQLGAEAGDALGIRHVERERPRGQPLGAQQLDRLGPPGGIAGAEDHVEAVASELAAHLEPDAAVSTGYDRSQHLRLASPRCGERRS